MSGAFSGFCLKETSVRIITTISKGWLNMETQTISAQFSDEDKGEERGEFVLWCGVVFVAGGGRAAEREEAKSTMWVKYLRPHVTAA
ncbi:hypothetical protein TIFTF001_022123 [Ficus carica]|uniref:Uncharacterized protein n=1 Tax=Ficus carica TaxID=3494 RepID=A0AA88AVG7_FICCA|nr:hypothetical protein TIFTF001_022123 [Ficus carica]